MERLLKKNETIEDVVNRINTLVDQNFEILDRDDDDITKWGTIPKLLLLDDEKIDRLLRFIRYMDTASAKETIYERALIIISLSGLIEYADFDFSSYDDGNLYLLANHYQNSTIGAMKNTINIIKNSDLLLAVRTKILDMEDRKILLKNIEDDIYSLGVNTNSKEEINNFIQKEIEKIIHTDMYR